MLCGCFLFRKIQKKSCYINNFVCYINNFVYFCPDFHFNFHLKIENGDKNTNKKRDNNLKYCDYDRIRP